MSEKGGEKKKEATGFFHRFVDSDDRPPKMKRAKETRFIFSFPFFKYISVA